MKACIYCRSEMADDALVCPKCDRSQQMARLAKVLSSPLPRLLNALGAGVAILLLSVFLQQRYEAYRYVSDRADRLSRSAVHIQILTEQLQQPCMAKDAQACADRFDKLVNELSEYAYTFKQEAYALAGEREIKGAVEFIDDFFNPGAMDLQAVLTSPVQIQLLSSREVLTRPYSKEHWCSPETRREVAALMLSINAYRYCYGVVRRYFSEISATTRGGLWWPTVPVESKPSFERCTRPTDAKHSFEQKIKDISNAIDFGANTDYAAPWVYHTYCGDTQGGSLAAPLLPTVTAQVIAVTTSDWSTTDGMLGRFELRAGEWVQIAGPVPIKVGRSGLGWGRGIHPLDAILATARDKAVVKTEGDGRAPAGVFRLGDVFSRDQMPDVNGMTVRTIQAHEYCEDRSDREQYNQAVVLTEDEIRKCQDAGSCPETLVRDDGIYDHFVWVRHNASPARSSEAGSCIFLHADHADRRPTAGCTSLPTKELGNLIRWLDAGKNPLLVQLPEREWRDRQREWGLPKPSWLH